ncbi:MAG: TetR/AcrR family transcriptional regulator [Bacillota bacterium]|jgi:AcrR family transcriptional regulator
MERKRPAARLEGRARATPNPQEPPEKPGGTRKRILDAAIREFAEKGYDNASTNSIVDAAGTSKGLLFHYFGSKDALYLAALDHCIEFQIEYFLKNLGELPADLVERVLTWGELKVKMLLEEPLMFKMAVGGIDGNPKGLNRELTARMARITERLMPAFLSGIDFSSLREGISPQKAIEFVFLVINAASEKFLAATKDSPDRGLSALNSALEEIKEYGEFLRTGLYRH